MMMMRTMPRCVTQFKAARCFHALIRRRRKNKKRNSGKSFGFVVPLTRFRKARPQPHNSTLSRAALCWFIPEAPGCGASQSSALITTTVTFLLITATSPALEFLIIYNGRRATGINFVPRRRIQNFHYHFLMTHQHQQH